ncbi:MAG: hypothetical protein Kow0020_09330 [Wenzhouxiangellaceae bacterium]
MTEALDVSDQGAWHAALDRIRTRFGGIDILVNNAGFHARGPFDALTPEQIRQMIEVNLTAPLVATRLVLNDLKRSQRPAVINVASLAGRTPVPGSVVYSATKFGLRAFGMALAEELHGSRIRIASVSPGPIDTAFIMDDIDSVSDLTFSQPIVTPEQVAAAIVRLVDGGPRDLPLPRISGWLTTLTYLFPGLGRMMRPMLERRGRRTKERIKRERSRHQSIKSAGSNPVGTTHRDMPEQNSPVFRANPAARLVARAADSQNIVDRCSFVNTMCTRNYRRHCLDTPLCRNRYR